MVLELLIILVTTSKKFIMGMEGAWGVTMLERPSYVLNHTFGGQTNWNLPLHTFILD